MRAGRIGNFRRSFIRAPFNGPRRPHRPFAETRCHAFEGASEDVADLRHRPSANAIEHY
jgi:hypothetical protein